LVDLLDLFRIKLIILCYPGSAEEVDMAECNQEPIRYGLNNPSFGEFFGRESELNCLLEWLTRCRNYECHKPFKPKLITGLGGLGKSSLLMEFIKQVVINGDEAMQKFHIVWISGERNRLQDSMLRFLNETNSFQLPCIFDLSEKNYFEDRIKQISKANETLLVIDNLEQKNQLLQFIYTPIKNLCVVVTSRDKTILDHKRIDHLDLTDLEVSDAIELFRSNIPGSSDQETIEHICSRLQNYPIALIQVSKYIGNHMRFTNLVYTVQDFIQEFECIARKLSILGTHADEFDQTVLLIWDTTIQYLENLQHGNKKAYKIALVLLKLLSYGIPTGIRQTWLKEVSRWDLIHQETMWNVPILKSDIETLSASDILDATLILCRFHLLAMDRGNEVTRDQCFKINQVVQLVTRLKSPEDWRPTDVESFVANNGDLANYLGWVSLS